MVTDILIVIIVIAFTIPFAKLLCYFIEGETEEKHRAKMDKLYKQITRNFYTIPENPILDEWYVDKYIDVHGDITDEKFMGFKTFGTFSASRHIIDFKLSVQLLVSRESVRFEFTEVDFNKKIRPSSDKGYEYTCIAVNEDYKEIKFKIDDTKELLRFMSGSRKVFFHIYNQYNEEYKFDINRNRFGYCAITEFGGMIV